MLTWLWNIKHRKLIKETKAIMKMYFFLRNDCGIKEADKLSASDLKELLGCLRRR
ncbi:MAG: hypothetical protein WC486_00625 [Candidatus Omnitrophota bacterium]